MAATPRCAGACFLLPLLLQATLLGLPCTAEQVLIPAGAALSTLRAGQYLERGAYKFEMQRDCNLVLYDHFQAIWSSGTAGKGHGCSAAITSDGYLVVKDGKGGVLWESEKSDLGDNYVLVLQPDRNVVIYNKPVWATGTYIPSPSTDAPALKNNTDEAARAAATTKGPEGAGVGAGAGTGRKMTSAVPDNMGV